MNPQDERISPGERARLLERLSAEEARVLAHLSQRRHVSRNTNDAFDASLTFGQRVADRVAAFGGSWPFIIIFLTIMLGWIVINTVVLLSRAFDPYPFILLNLVLSMLAALQAPIIMMSQNRQAAKDRLDAAHDYEVNLKAEVEIMGLHQKIDGLREQQWADLVAMQQEQIRLLLALLRQAAPQDGAAAAPDIAEPHDAEEGTRR